MQYFGHQATFKHFIAQPIKQTEHSLISSVGSFPLAPLEFLSHLINLNGNYG